MATAPWAKLKMPDVVYVTTRPDAAMPYTPPVTNPRIVYCRNVCTGIRPLLLLRLELGGDAVLVELGLVDHASRQLDGSVGVAVDLALLLGGRLHPRRAVELGEHRALGGHVPPRVRLRVQPAAGPAGDLGQLVQHALPRQVGAALLRGRRPQQERRRGLLAQLADVAAVLGHDVEVLLGGRVRVGLLERRERGADVHAVAVARGVPFADRWEEAVG